MAVPRHMYEELKRLWLSTADTEQRAEAAQEFDEFITALLKEGSERGQAANPATDEPEVSQSRMLMEMIIEVDTAVQMVPPRLKQYRDLLAAEGLDKTADVSGDGQKGLAGINLADQAALAFHQALLGMAMGIAQAEVMERMNRKTDAD